MEVERNPGRSAGGFQIAEKNVNRGLLRGLLAGALLLAGAGLAEARDFSTPEEALDYIYQSYGPESWPEQADVFSSGLMELVTADEDRTPEGEIGALDFDPFTASQDPQPDNVRYGAVRDEGETVVIPVTFTNGGDQEYALDYTLVQEDDGWRVDDIQMPGEYGWSLRELLLEGEAG